jgi:hypothetical protein
MYFYGSGFYFWIDGLRITLFNRTGNSNYAFLAYLLYGVFIMQNNLGNTKLIPKVEECYSAVIADGICPAGKFDSLPNMLLSQLTACMCPIFVHGFIMPDYPFACKWAYLL